jgi:hypothetical protein
MIQEELGLLTALGRKETPVRADVRLKAARHPQATRGGRQPSVPESTPKAGQRRANSGNGEPTNAAEAPQGASRAAMRLT